MAVDILATLVPVAGFFAILWCCSCGVTQNMWNRVRVLNERVQQLEEQQIRQQNTAAPQVVIPVQQQTGLPPAPYPYRQGAAVNPAQAPQLQPQPHLMYQVTYPPAPSAPLSYKNVV